MPDPTPTPVPAVLCSVCSLPWDDHTARANALADPIVVEGPGYHDRTQQPTDAPVTLLVCLRLTQDAQRGPRGRQGDTGPMGASGSLGVLGLFAEQA